MQGCNIVENPSWGMQGNYGGYPSDYAMVNSQSNCYGESYGYDRMAGKTRGQYNNSPYGTHYQTRILAEVPLLTDQRVASGPSNGHGHRHCHERYPHRRRRRHRHRHKSRDGQSYGHGYGQLHGNGYGHSYGQSYGHGYGQSHGQSHGQNYDGEESYCVLYACSEKLLQCRDGDRERLRKLTTLLPRDRDRNGGSDSESGSGSECGSDSESGSGSDCD